MKKLLLIVLFSVPTFAQQVCYVPNTLAPTKTTCMTITNSMLSSLNIFITTQVGPSPDGGKTPGTPLYKGIGDLIFQNLTKGLFTALVVQIPPTTVVNAQTTLNAAQSALDSAKNTIIAIPTSVPDPQ